MQNNWLQRMNGLADEAGITIELQIDAHQQLSWRKLELRTVNGVTLDQLSITEINDLHKQLNSAGMSVPIIAASLGNWQSSLRSSIDDEVALLKKYIIRMKVLGATYLRIMSYPCLKNMSDNEWAQAVLSRFQRFVSLAEKENITLLHENCIGWAGRSPEKILFLINKLDSNNFGLLYDIGNGVAYEYDSLDFLNEIFPWVKHVHIKDAQRTNNETRYCLPGLGQANVSACVKFLLQNNYDGDFSIEPHILQQIHNLPSQHPEPRLLFNTYVRYAKAWMNFFSRIWQEQTLETSRN